MKVETLAAKVKLLAFDVDGVLTGGQLLFGPDGEVMKVFHVHDGLGIAAAGRAGLKTAVLTGRQSEMVRRRGEELGITEICQGVVDKGEVLAKLAARHGLTLTEIGYVGDDLNDLAILHQVGLACAVANAVPEVLAAVHFVTTRKGGRGAVREVIELVLKAQGRWGPVVESYGRPGGGPIKQ